MMKLSKSIGFLLFAITLIFKTLQAQPCQQPYQYDYPGCLGLTNVPAQPNTPNATNTYVWPTSVTGATLVSGQGTQTAVYNFTSTGHITINVTITSAQYNCTYVITHHYYVPVFSTTQIQGASIPGTCTGNTVFTYYATRWRSCTTGFCLPHHETHNWTVNGGTIVSQSTFNQIGGSPYGYGTTDTIKIQWNGTGMRRLILSRFGSHDNNLVPGPSNCNAYDTLMPTAGPATISGPTSGCNISTATYTVNPDTGYTYTWTVTGNGTLASGQGTTSATVNWTGSGMVKVVKSFLWCNQSYRDSVNFVGGPAPTPNLGPNTTFCQGSNFTLNAGPGTTYLWSTGATTPTIQPNASGTYSVTVSNGPGCTGSSSVNLTMLPQPVPTLSYFPMVVCPGSNATLSAGVWSAYLWSTGATTPSITVTPPGTWSVTVTDASGCTGSATTNIVTAPGPNPNLGPNQTVCAGSPIILNPGTFVSYIWSTGATTGTISPTTSGTYSVTVSDANGCTGSATTTLTFNPAPTPNLGPNQTICSGNSATLNPGTFASYLWSTGATTQTITVSNAGTYSVTVTDGNGCTGVSSITLTTAALPTPTISQFPLIVCQGQTAYLDAGVWLSVIWSTGATTSGITVSPPGTWSVTVTDVSGCTGYASINSIVAPLPSFSLGPDTFICADTFVTLNGPAGMSSYNWSTSATTQGITVIAGGNYALTVTDASGCTASDDKLITGLTDCVFPGDANYDGVADNADILSIGAYYGYTGATRPGANLQWYGQSLADWGGALPGNADPKHSDCDGNGTVAAVDTQAVTLNYGQTHSKGAGVNTAALPLRIRAMADSIYPGDAAWFVVELGDAQNVADSVYGLAFRLSPSGNAMISPGLFTTDYTNCWYAPGGARIDFTQSLGANNPVDVAVVRNDQMDQMGYGEVMRFAVATDGNMVAVRDILNVGISNVVLVNQDLVDVPVQGINGSIVVSHLVAAVSDPGSASRPEVFPNPALNFVEIRQAGAMMLSVTVMDAAGKHLLEKAVDGNQARLETEQLAGGIYMLRIHSDAGIYTEKLVILGK